MHRCLICNRPLKTTTEATGPVCSKKIHNRCFVCRYNDKAYDKYCLSNDIFEEDTNGFTKNETTSQNIKKQASG